MKVINPVTTETFCTLARSTTANYFDESRVLRQALSNTLRQNWNPATLAYEGYIIEPARTNYILNSASLTNTTQSRSITGGPLGAPATYTLSFYGTGTVRLENAGVAVGGVVGAFNLTGSPLTTPTFTVDAAVSAGAGSVPANRVYQTFTVTGGTLIVTITGTVRFAQIEEGAFATSIIVNVGSQVTRAADVITGSGLLASTFPSYEAAFPAEYGVYTIGATYTIGDKIILNGFIYQALVAGVAGTGPTEIPAPSFRATTASWLYIGADNLFLPFDREVSTKASAAAAVDVFCVVLPALADGVALMNLECDSITVAVNNRTGSIITQSASGRPTELVVQVTPAAFDVVSVRMTKGALPANKIGEFVAGLLYDIGQTQYGVSIGITDYSKKVTDEFGNTSFVKRAFSKKMQARLLLDKSKFNTVVNLLSDLRASPSVWIATDDAAYSSGVVIYGYYKDFALDISYPTMCSCSLEVEGLI